MMTFVNCFVSILSWFVLVCLHMHRKVTPETPPKYNELDGKVDRRSHLGKYELVDGLPR